MKNNLFDPLRNESLTDQLLEYVIPDEQQMNRILNKSEQKYQQRKQEVSIQADYTEQKPIRHTGRWISIAACFALIAVTGGIGMYAYRHQPTAENSYSSEQFAPGYACEVPFAEELLQYEIYLWDTSVDYLTSAFTDEQKLAFLTALNNISWEEQNVYKEISLPDKNFIVMGIGDAPGTENSDNAAGFLSFYPESHVVLWERNMHSLEDHEIVEYPLMDEQYQNIFNLLVYNTPFGDISDQEIYLSYSYGTEKYFDTDDFVERSDYRTNEYILPDEQKEALLNVLHEISWIQQNKCNYYVPDENAITISIGAPSTYPKETKGNLTFCPESHVIYWMQNEFDNGLAGYPGILEYALTDEQFQKIQNMIHEEKPNENMDDASRNSELNLAVSMEDVTPTGGTLVLNPIDETLPADVSFGEEYFIQRLEDGYATDIEMNCCTWNALARIWTGEPTRIALNWEELYTELPAGTYQLVKHFNEKPLCARFTIGNYPFGNITDDIICFTSSAHGCYPVETELQSLSDILNTAPWNEIDVDTLRPDGEYKIMHVYNQGNPYILEFYADHTVKFQNNQESRAYQITEIMQLAVWHFADACADLTDIRFDQNIEVWNSIEVPD